MRAPRNVELRLALIGILVEQQKFADALSQYEQLDRVEPNNPDHLREWGRLILRDSSKPEARAPPGGGRGLEAAAAWSGPASRRGGRRAVADLFRQAGMVDDALALYRQAVEIAPESANQRIHLGEYLHSLDRRAEALATWKADRRGPGGAMPASSRPWRTCCPTSTTGPRRSRRWPPPANLPRATWVSSSSSRTCTTARGKPRRRSRCWRPERRWPKAPSRLEQVLSRRIQFEQAAGVLEERAAGLEKALAEGRESGALPWYQLARYREASRQWPAAAAAIRRAKDAIGAAAAGASQASIWSAAARIFEGAGQLPEAADALRRLAAVDSKNRSEALRQVARIESKLNHRDAALQAGRDLLAAAPGDAEHYRFFANLCFQLDAPR